MDTYDGIINKPEMEDLFIEHGLHKYIDKYLGKSGKWIYKYAGKTKNALNKARLKLKKPESHISLESKVDAKYLTKYDPKKWSGAHANEARYVKNNRWKDVANARTRASQRYNMKKAIQNKKAMGSSNRTDKPYYRTEEFDFGNGIKVKKRGVVRTVKKKK